MIIIFLLHLLHKQVDLGVMVVAHLELAVLIYMGRKQIHLVQQLQLKV